MLLGQHDWADCGLAHGGTYDPVERLDFVRQLFFADASSLGQNPLTLSRESDVARFRTFREIVRWQAQGHRVHRAECAEPEQSLSDRGRAQRRVRRSRRRDDLLARTCGGIGATLRDARARHPASGRSRLLALRAARSLRMAALLALEPAARWLPRTEAQPREGGGNLSRPGRRDSWHRCARAERLSYRSAFAQRQGLDRHESHARGDRVQKAAIAMARSAERCTMASAVSTARARCEGIRIRKNRARRRPKRRRSRASLMRLIPHPHPRRLRCRATICRSRCPRRLRCPARLRAAAYPHAAAVLAADLSGACIGRAERR